MNERENSLADHSPGRVMSREIDEIPSAVAKLISRNRSRCDELGQILRAGRPALLVTCARGSSSHACTFARHVFERYLGVPTSSATLSTASIYRSGLSLDRAWVLAVSQSGSSPDLRRWVKTSRDSGARVIGLVNDEDSPLASETDFLLPLSVGPERAVAATKSFVGSAVAMLQLAAAWSQDAELEDILRRLPDALESACRADWSAPVDELASASSMFIVGRGPGLGIAQEAALKLKETCRMHAEGISSGEFPHGPMAMVSPGTPILAFRQNDESAAGLDELTRDLRAKGARVWVTRRSSDGDGSRDLPLPDDPHPLVQSLAAATSFYRLAWQLSLKRGLDPDRPPHIRKVTKTC